MAKRVYDFKIYENPGSDLCMYEAFVFYLGKISPKIRDDPDLHLILRPSSTTKTSDKYWFDNSSAYRGVRNWFTDLEKLITKLKLGRIYNDENPFKFERKYVNHSIRTETGCQMMRHNVDRRISSKKLGHSSEASMLPYTDDDRFNDDAIQALSNRDLTISTLFNILCQQCDQR